MEEKDSCEPNSIACRGRSIVLRIVQCEMILKVRPFPMQGKLLGDAAAVGAMLDRLLHHGHLLKCGPRSWRTKTTADAG